MQEFEKLGAFYLGRPYDLERQKPKEGLLLYDSKDLVTHAVCVGMTGSGKTGLCIGLLEEAAMDGIPAIAIDPKGDLSNILLTFPSLAGPDFAPWIDEEEATRVGVSAQEYANRQAELWKKGLSEWGQDADRIARLRQAADFVIYTPASNAGSPVSVLGSFSAPNQALLDDREAFGDRLRGTVTSLLGLLGIEADPIQSREHILLSSILGAVWQKGQSIDLAELIRLIQDPPVQRIGVLELESFYPQKDRFGLAMQLNNLLASPGFEAWMEGEPLNISTLLHGPKGKPRVSVFSIAHLNDRERMFFVSLLLQEILAWVRTQSGTGSLRAIVYMDEIFGYFPPVANPPSKTPLLTLLKQARAFGVGIVLATQNPVDLDYKGLANTGTWFIGKLQTERDKARVLDGLEGIVAGARLSRDQLDKTLSSLSKRIFLMNNVHDDGPEVFETRWTMSYLRGPLTRTQIKTLMATESSAQADADDKPADAGAAGSALPPDAANARSTLSAPPSVPPEIPSYFLPIRGSAPGTAALVYVPALLGNARVSFSDSKIGVSSVLETTVITGIIDGPVPVTWEEVREAGVAVADLEKQPAQPAEFGALPPVTVNPKKFAAFNKEFVNWVYGSQKLELLKSVRYRQFSNPGESEREFRIRLQQTAREERDRDIETLKRKFAPRTQTLQDRIRRAQQAVEVQQAQARQSQAQTAISFGATILGSIFGRKTMGVSTLGRATTAARGVGRSMKESGDVERAQVNVEDLGRKLADLESEFQAEIAKLEALADTQAEPLERISIKPKKTNISVALLALAWLPHWKEEGADALKPAWL